MRKGTKRKTAAAAAATTQKEEGLKESTKAVSRAKRVKATKPESEPEYFEDQRNLEDLWKEVFPVGTEWDQLDLVYKFKWDFSNLENAFEEGGKLYGQKVYLFGSTEPQLIPVKGENKMIIIPVVVAVVSPFPPSDKIGINSVQRVKEDIVPMKQMKMDWVPYIPLENRDSQVDKLKSQIYILSCTQRRTALKRLKIERVKEYEYCLPYFFDPSKEDDDDLDSRVDISYPEEEPTTPFPCEFDWEFDELEDFTVKLIEGGYLTEDQKASFKEHVKEKVRGKKKAYKEAKQARKKVIDDMGEEKKAAIKAIKFYKFYPVATPDTPDVSSVKAHYINRYYGKAHEVL